MSSIDQLLNPSSPLRVRCRGVVVTACSRALGKTTNLRGGAEMSRKRLSLCIAALVAAAACVLAVAASAAVAPSGPPTSTGTGGAAASVETLATQAAIDALKRAATRSTRPSRPPASSASPSRSRAGSAAAASWSSAPRTARSTTIDGRETRAGRDDADVVLGERHAAAVQRRALQRHVRRRARHARDVGEGAREVRHDLARAGAAGRHPRRARRLRRRPDVLRPDAGAVRDWFDDVPATAALYLDPDGTAARRRHRLPQPRPRERRTSGSPTSARKASTAARSPTRS